MSVEDLPAWVSMAPLHGVHVMHSAVDSPKSVLGIRDGEQSWSRELSEKLNPPALRCFLFQRRIPDLGVMNFLPWKLQVVQDLIKRQYCLSGAGLSKAAWWGFHSVGELSNCRNKIRLMLSIYRDLTEVFKAKISKYRLIHSQWCLEKLQSLYGEAFSEAVADWPKPPRLRFGSQLHKDALTAALLHHKFQPYFKIKV